MRINQTMQGLKIFCEETNSDALTLVISALEATGKFVVVPDGTYPTDVIRTFGHFLLNTEIRTLQWKEEKPVQITGRENQILCLLLENAGRVVKRRFILSSFWGDEGEYASRSLDIFIYRLRKKLKKDPTVLIHTIRGEGFMLTC
ncbi:MAG: winged helix-turn-helix domain-containing protein [Dysgonamonadaceae bacterium]|jgi:DNA-binding response OmpR family regulator|nr:winged helix-turn-helix domain-containing protein [Dysgonamonadaceae bacterium]